MTSLYRHQRDGATWLWRNGQSGLLAYEPGLGKTCTSLQVIALSASKHGVKWLVIAPKRLMWVWQEECAKWAPQLSVQILWREGTKDKLAVDEKADVVITSRDTFRILSTKSIISPEQFGGIVVDESSMMKSRKTKITRGILKFSAQIPRRIALSGTPAPNTPLEFYPQVDFVKPGSLGMFMPWRAKHFKQIGEKSWDKWVPRHGHFPLIMDEIAPHVLFRTKEDCLDLPPRVVTPLVVDLAKDEARAYRQWADEWRLETEEGKEISAANVLAHLAKARQIVSGALYAEEDGNRVVKRLGKTKLNAAVELLTEELAGRPVIVVYQFIHEAEALLKELGKEAQMIRSDMAERDKWAAIKGFQDGTSGKTWLLIHPRSCGHGLTLTRASEILWLSVSHSLEEFLQTQDRIHRIGQSRPCTVYALVAKGTVDEEILAALRAKKGVADVFKNGLKGGAK